MRNGSISIFHDEAIKHNEAITSVFLTDVLLQTGLFKPSQILAC